MAADWVHGEEEDFTWQEWLRGGSACILSMACHMVLLVVLAMVGFDQSTRQEVQSFVAAPLVDRPDEEPLVVELDQDLVVAETTDVALVSSAPAAIGIGEPGAVGLPGLDQKVVAQAAAAGPDISVEAPTLTLPASLRLIEAVPDGKVKGDPRAIVGNYQEALDRLTQEIMWMLDQGPALVVWLFDESESMKDDQQEIRDRFQHVYEQLGIYGRSESQALLTGIASYGQSYRIHTARPTGTSSEIKAAIDAIPSDPSGDEMMCQAVGQTIRDFRKFATRGRQMALILVTDESGDRENNDRFLEAALAEAKSARCKIFVLGREAVFGYPYAHISWRHPQTRRTHWLRIDRGPETGFPEQLQTNGLHRRHDAFSSGFGPYEQCRLARETNGVFFMLPSIESNLVGGQQKQRYALESLRPFRPDLRARVEVLRERGEYPLRALIWQVVSDLNPWRSDIGREVELRVEFSKNPVELVQQVRTNQVKAVQLLKYLAEAQQALERGRRLREQEADPRWQANYDLIYAQIISYQARIYEYGVGLQPYLANPPLAPLQKPGNLVLVDWNLRTQPGARSPESPPVIAQATSLLNKVIADFPGTPWAARAQWELSRGFGVDLIPDYDEAYVEVSNPSPPPKL